MNGSLGISVEQSWGIYRLPFRRWESLWARLSDCMFSILESDLQSFRRHQGHGLLGKLHDTVGVHQDLDGPRRHVPALKYLQETEMHQCALDCHPPRVPSQPTQDDQSRWDSYWGLDSVPQKDVLKSNFQYLTM